MGINVKGRRNIFCRRWMQTKDNDRLCDDNTKRQWLNLCAKFDESTGGLSHFYKKVYVCVFHRDFSLKESSHICLYWKLKRPLERGVRYTSDVISLELYMASRLSNICNTFNIYDVNFTSWMSNFLSFNRTCQSQWEHFPW